MAEGWLTSTYTAMLFYRVCSRYKIDKLEDRLALLRQLTRRKRAKYVRDVAEFSKGKKVSVIVKKEKS